MDLNYAAEPSPRGVFGRSRHAERQPKFHGCEHPVNLMLFLGCLSPEEMRLSVQIGYYAAAFAVGVTLALVLLNWHRGSFAWLPIYGVLLVLHPAWTMGVLSGDCGYAKRFFSGAVSLLFVAVLICQIFWAHLSRGRFLLALCATCWAAYCALWCFRLLRLAPPEHGFIADVIQSFMLSSQALFRVALALTAVSLTMWLLAKRGWVRER
jgi:hypothetical protein